MAAPTPREMHIIDNKQTILDAF